MNDAGFPFGIGRRFRKRWSVNRKSMHVMTLESIPAYAVNFMLGGPFQTGFLLYLGASPLQIAIALAMPNTMNFMQVAGALLLQRISNRKFFYMLFTVSHRSIWAACGFIPILFPEKVQAGMYIAVCSLSFMSKYVGAPAWSSLAGDLVPAQLRGTYFGIRNMILWGAGIVCLWIGGRVLDAHPGGEGFNILFIICGFCALAQFLLIFGYANPPFEKSRESYKKDMLLAPFRHAPYRRMMGFIALCMLVFNISIPMFTYVMQSIMHVGYEMISYLTIIQNVVMMASYYLWGRLTLRYSTRALLFWTLPFLSLSCLLWGMVALLPAVIVLLAIHVLLGIGLSGFTLLILNISIGDTPKSERAMFTAMFNSIIGLAGFVGSFVGGYMYKQLKLADAPLWLQTYGVSTFIGGLLLLLGLTLGSRMLLERPFRRRSSVQLSDHG